MPVCCLVPFPLVLLHCAIQIHSFTVVAHPHLLFCSLPFLSCVSFFFGVPVRDCGSDRVLPWCCCWDAQTKFTASPHICFACSWVAVSQPHLLFCSVAILIRVCLFLFVIAAGEKMAAEAEDDA